MGKSTLVYEWDWYIWNESLSLFLNDTDICVYLCLWMKLIYMCVYTYTYDTYINMFVCIYIYIWHAKRKNIPLKITD